MSNRPSRTELLTSRVRWLDRYRRGVAIIAAIVISPLLVAQLIAGLGGEWPEIHATLLSLMLGVMVWCVVEVALVWVTAWWATECDRLLRDRGLPRAIVRK